MPNAIRPLANAMSFRSSASVIHGTELFGNNTLVDGKRVSLEELCITEISVGYAEAGLNRDASGNEHRQVGEGFVRNGQQGAVNDVWFQYQAGAGESSGQGA